MYYSRMVTHSQIRGARSMLGLSQADLSKHSGVSLPRVVAIEAGRDCLQSTWSAIVTALESKGARFSPDGSVRIVPERERFITAGNPSPETLHAAMRIVNSARRARNLPELKL